MTASFPAATAVPLAVDIPTTDPALDLTTVTNVVLSVTRRDGSTATWNAEPQAGAIPSMMSAIYMMTDTDAVPLGRYQVGVFLEGPNVPSSAFEMLIVPLWRWKLGV